MLDVMTLIYEQIVTQHKQDLGRSVVQFSFKLTFYTLRYRSSSSHFKANKWRLDTADIHKRQIYTVEHSFICRYKNSIHVKRFVTELTTFPSVSSHLPVCSHVALTENLVFTC